MKFKAIVTIAALTISGAVMAQASAPKASTATPGLDKREASQQKRIDQGVATGQLTASETNNLDKRQAKLVANETAAKADGKVTKAERRKLNHQANRNSRVIYKKKHNVNTATPVAK